ncbi:MAG: sigma-70 family RNA polymerase sigma factor [Lewinellaceae bacterium]|nr:sigma-70 family RNA polymerase sigma factor [Lewinellaceae bacterium]
MKRQHLTPAEALAGIRNCDQTIIGRYYRYVRRRAFRLFCYGQPGSPAYVALEDCFNPAFLAFLARARSPQFEPRNLDAFALEFVRRSFLDALKKERRHGHAELTPDADQPDGPAPHLTAESLFGSQPNLLLLHWYSSLEKVSRRLLDLRVQGYNHYEIAERLPLAPGTVRNRYSALVREAKGVVEGGVGFMGAWVHGCIREPNCSGGTVQNAVSFV